MQIKETSLHFGRLLEEVVFNEGISSAEVRDVVTKINDWLDKNCYPRINEFLDTLDRDDVKAIYTLFSRGANVKSSAELPIFEDLSEKGQATELSLPFKGEVRVAREEQAAENPASTRNSWTFTTTIQPAPAGKSTPAGQGRFEAIAPAPGQPAYETAATAPAAIPAQPAAATCQATGTVLFNHSSGESSLFSCVDIPAARPKDNELVVRDTLIAYAAPAASGEMPSFRYTFIKTAKGTPADFQPRFALYFALGENEDTFRLVLSGVPQPGQYLIDHETHIKRNSR